MCVRVCAPLSVNGKSYISSVYPRITLDLFPLLLPGLVTFTYKIAAYLRERIAARQAEKERAVLSDLTCYAGVF